MHVGCDIMPVKRRIHPLLRVALYLSLTFISVFLAWSVGWIVKTHIS